MDSVIIFRKLYEKPLIITSLIVAAIATSLYLTVKYVQLPGFLEGILGFLSQLFLPLSFLALISALLLKLTDHLFKGKEPLRRFGVTPLPHYEMLARTRMPKQLKTQISGNREKEVAQAEEFIKGDTKLLVISGERGIGKSTLAAYIARRVDFWLNLEGKDVDQPYLVHQLAQWKKLEELRKRAINLGQISIHEINALVDAINSDSSRIYLNSFGTLVDEKGNFKDKEVELLFRSLLESEGEGKVVLIASRVPECLGRYIEAGTAVNISLSGLSLESGVKLLQEKYSSEDGETWLQEISEAVEGNPLLLQIVPPVLSDDDSVNVIRNRSWKNSNNPACLDLDFLRKAAGEGLSLLQKIAFIPEPVTESFIVALADDSSTAAELIKDLKKRSLLEWDGGMKKCYLHPLITATAFESLIEDKSQFEKVRQHVIDVCVRKAEDFKPPSKWTSVSDCRLYLHAIDLMLESGQLQESMDLLVRIHPYVMQWANLRLLNSFYTRLIDIWKQSDVKLNEEQQSLLTKVLLNLVDTELAGRGQRSAIYPAHALLLLSKARKNLNGKIAASSLLSRLYLKEKNAGEAVKYSDIFINTVQETGEPLTIAAAMNQAGKIYGKTNLFAKAELMFSKAEKIYREAKDYAGEANSLGLMAKLCSNYGHPEEALELLQSKIDLVKTYGDDKERLSSMKALGDVHQKSGNSDQAIAIWDGVAAEAVDKEYWQTASQSLKSLANHSLKIKDFTASILRGQKRLEIALKIEDKEMEASSRAIMGIAYAKSREFANSLESYSKARDLYLGLNMVKQAARCYYYIARLQGVADEWEKASRSIVETVRLTMESKRHLTQENLKLMLMCRSRYGNKLFDEMAISSIGGNDYNYILQIIS